MANTYINLALGGSGGGGGGGVTNPLTANLNQDNFDILSSGGNDTWTVLPAEGGAGIQAALDAAVLAGGGTIQLFAGTYVVDAEIANNAADNITIQGMGRNTVLEIDTTVALNNNTAINLETPFSADVALNNTTKGTSSITFTTVANAGGVSAGDVLIIRGTDSNSEVDSEFAIAAANGNPGTGVVTLLWPLLRTMTGVFAAHFSDGKYNTIKNISLIHVAGANPVIAVNMGHSLQARLENVWVDDLLVTGSIALSMQGSVGAFFDDCKTQNIDSYGYELSSSIGAQLDGCVAIRNALDLTSGDVHFDRVATDGRVDNGTFLNSQNISIKVDNTSSLGCRRIVISRNFFSRARIYGLSLARILDCEVVNNTLDNIVGNYAIFCENSCKRISIDANQIENCDRGINMAGTIGGSISDNNFRSMTNQGIISQNGSDSILISGNLFISTGDTAVYVATAERHNISNNVIRDSATQGVELIADVNGCVINNNLIYNSGGDGIKLANDCDNNLVMGNNLSGDGIVQGTGTGNVFANNIL